MDDVSRTMSSRGLFSVARNGRGMTPRILNEEEKVESRRYVKFGLGLNSS